MQQPQTTTPFSPAAPALSRDTTHAALRAASYALHAYPGPVGALIDRELRSYVDSGHAAHPAALPSRLIATLAAAESREPAATPGRNSTAGLPARYRLGSPLHWEYPTSSTSPATD
jgi:hypothetical protein